MLIWLNLKLLKSGILFLLKLPVILQIQKLTLENDFKGSSQNGMSPNIFQRSISAIENGRETHGTNNSNHLKEHVGLKNVMSFPQLFTDSSEMDSNSNGPGPAMLQRSISSQGLSDSQPITKDDKKSKTKFKGLRSSFRKRKKSKINLLDSELGSTSISESNEAPPDVASDDLPVFDEKTNFVANVLQKFRRGSIKKSKVSKMDYGNILFFIKILIACF